MSHEYGNRAYHRFCVQYEIFRALDRGSASVSTRKIHISHPYDRMGARKNFYSLHCSLLLVPAIRSMSSAKVKVAQRPSTDGNGSVMGSKEFLPDIFQQHVAMKHESQYLKRRLQKTSPLLMKSMAHGSSNLRQQSLT